MEQKKPDVEAYILCGSGGWEVQEQVRMADHPEHRGTWRVLEMFCLHLGTVGVG